MNRIPTLFALPLLGALLAACSGTDLPADGAGADGSTSIAAAAPVSWPVAPLIDDEGNVMPSDPTAVPADPGAQTRARRYATAAQAEQLEHVMKTRVITIDVGNEADAAQAIDMAVMFTFGLQAVQNVGNDAPVLVRGSDLRRAATLANRLQDHGYSRVFLVAP